MCGIAGMIDLAGRRPVPAGAVEAMAQALYHRGPDEDGFLERPGLTLANRRLSIVGLADGRQPIFNEDRAIGVVFNGELFDYPEERAALESRGHRFVTHCDTELLPHLWEEHGEGMFERLRGQFAIALWDGRRQRVVLGRDRFGICPLYWTRQGDWLLFASEIKGLLASGLMDARPDLRGISHIFTFFALPGPVTCFEGVQLLPAGHFLRVQLAGAGQAGHVSEHTYWEIDFPDRGQEEPGDNEKRLVDGFEEVLLRATEKRLRADVPVVSYLSGGLDSTTVVALASHVRKQPIPAFTIRIDDPGLDETSEATIAARHIGTEPMVVNFGAAEVLNTFPRLIWAAEAPVIDTSCAALLLLAQEVHARGYKVALTGEGADEWLAGYPWYKIDKLLSYLDIVPGLHLSQGIRQAFLRLTGAPRFPRGFINKVHDAVGGHNPWLDLYGMVSLAKLRFFSPWMQEQLADHIAYADLGINLDRLRRWHPLNRALYFGIRIHLAGLLLNAKGDRVAMHSSVETRYPYLDEDVFAYLAPLHPRWKMRGFKEKYLLRRLAERWLPKSIAWRRKAMFRAPFDSFFSDDPARVPAFIDQLLSPESLHKTGYFDAAAVQYWRHQFRGLRAGSKQRIFLEMGLVGVVATQLWHHTYIDGGLADLPSHKVEMAAV
jgi:asparagine synthase (glutamine-hydrolysing)